MKGFIDSLKKDYVLLAAWVLALISAFFVPPSAAYLGYIDIRSLGILWGLMVIMQVFRENGLFDFVGQKLLKKTGRFWQLASVLIFLCFFFSMLITNDVALITFVPFAVMMLHECKRDDMLIPVIVLQTVAANLGSMMTPVGNPQNLYLYGISDLSFGAFIALVLPYTAAAFVLLCVSIALLKGKAFPVSGSSSSSAALRNVPVMAVFAVLFVVALMVVARVLPWYLLVLAVLAAALALCRGVLAKADYALLLTFVGFFIFTGNLGSIPAIENFLKNAVNGHELVTAVAASQAISNVPAALLLSGFAGDLRQLILGVNFGGLGTLIASMASLISYKHYAATENANKGRYLLSFTVINIIFLAALMAFQALLSR